MSSESSEDENLERLREAADNEFTRHLFDANHAKTAQKNKPVPKPSLRYQDEEEQNTVKIAPQFQKFVAKQLMTLVDSEIKEIVLPTHKNKRKTEGGILLLTSSTDIISGDGSIDCTNLGRRKNGGLKQKKNSKIPKKHADITEEEKCQAAAVSADWVLSQQAIAGWEPSTKGKLEVFQADEVEMRSTHNQILETEQLKQLDQHSITMKRTETPSLSLEEKEEKKKLKRKRHHEKKKLMNLLQMKEKSLRT